LSPSGHLAGSPTELYHEGAISHWSQTCVVMGEQARSRDQNGYAFAPMWEYQALSEFLTFAADFYAAIQYTGELMLSHTIVNPSPPAIPQLLLQRPWPRDAASSTRHERDIRVSVRTSAAAIRQDIRPTIKAIADELAHVFGLWEAECFDDEFNLRWPSPF
jgi:hypothetical protein